jgi:hypothetical protein
LLYRVQVREFDSVDRAIGVPLRVRGPRYFVAPFSWKRSLTPVGRIERARKTGAGDGGVRCLTSNQPIRIGLAVGDCLRP